MRKHHSRNPVPKGRVVDTRTPGVHICPGMYKPGVLLPVKTVTIRNSSGKDWRAFVHLCRKLGISWKIPVKMPKVEDRWSVDGKVEKPTVDQDRPVDFHAEVEVMGSPGSLTELFSMDYVLIWKDCLNISEPCFRYGR